MAERYNLCIDNIDDKLLDKQRAALRLDIENAWGEHKEYLEGIEALLDHISDLIYHGDYQVTESEEAINEKKQE